MIKKVLFLLFLTLSILKAGSFDTGMKFFIKGQYKQAMPHFIKASNAGNKQAQFYLANMYEKGLGVKKDRKMASKLYKLYTAPSKSKTAIKSYPKKIKKKSRKKVRKKTVRKKSAIKKVRVKKAKKKPYSKKLKKHYNPELQGAKEVIFN